MKILHQGEEFKKWLKTNELSVRKVLKILGKKYDSDIYSMFKTKNFQYETRQLLLDKLGYVVKEYSKDDAQEQKSPYISNELTELKSESFQLIPVVNRLAYASYSSYWDDAEYINSLQKIPAPVPKDGIYRWFEISGDSMTCDDPKTINEGDLVLCRKLYREHWKNKFHLKKYKEWIIVHRERGIMLKEIIHQDTSNGEIVCHSYNPMEKDFTLHLDDVMELYYVKIVQKSR